MDRYVGGERAEETFREVEERQPFLLGLSDALRAEPSADAGANRAIRMLSEHMRLDRCCITSMRLENDRADVTHQVGNDRVPPLHNTYRAFDFPESYRVMGDQTLVIEGDFDREGASEAEKRNIQNIGIQALLSATLRKGENHPLWGITALAATPRRWTRGEVALVEEGAERTWAAMERARAEEALRESEERYRLTVEAADLGCWELVPESGEFHTSPTCNRHLGLPEDVQPTHEGHFRTIHPDDHAMIYERLRRAVEEGGEFEADYRVIHSSGGFRLVLSRARLLCYPGPEPYRLTGVTLDVTEARELEEERERSRARELTALAEAAEKERISRELHDRVAHGLGVAHQSLELFSALRDADPERAAERLELARDATRLARDRTRDLSAELKSLQDEELAEGLQAAFEKLADNYVPDGTAMEISFSGDQATVAAPVGMQVYLTMREAVRNAVRHSGCSRIAVRLVIDDE